MKFQKNRLLTQVSAAKDNKWYNLILGFLGGLSSGSSTEIDKLSATCFPEGWSTATPAEDNEGKAAATAAQPGSAWTAFLDIVESGINFACKFKTDIVDWLKKKFSSGYYKRNHYKNMVERVYTQAFWDSLKDVVNSGIQKIKDAAGALIQKAKDALSGIGDWIATKIAAAKAKFQAILNNPTVQRIIRFVKCAKDVKGLVQGLVDAVKGIYDKIDSIVTAVSTQTYVGIIPVIVDLICAFQYWRAAINECVKIGTFTDAQFLLRWKQIGVCVGSLFYALSK
jgi:hypothetical protein